MCQYFISLYICGHQREEYVECDAASTKPLRRRCGREKGNKKYYGSVVQPCGCLQGQKLAELTRKVRYARPQNKEECERLVELYRDTILWRCSPAERYRTVNGRREKLIKAIAMLEPERRLCVRPMPVEYYCVEKVDDNEYHKFDSSHETKLAEREAKQGGAAKEGMANGYTNGVVHANGAMLVDGEEDIAPGC